METSEDWSVPQLSIEEKMKKTSPTPLTFSLKKNQQPKTNPTLSS